MKFYGRASEIEKLNKEIETPGLRAVLIYGRRRIGKSELVKKVLRESTKTAFYYECNQVSEASNAEGLCAVVSDRLGLPKLGYGKMGEALDYLFKISETQKLVLALDEYPYLRENAAGIDSVLQNLIDKHKDTANLTLILLGSYVDTMKSLLEKSNPLYGRIDLTIALKQMDYYDSALFYPSFSEEDKVRLYSVFGGIPHYNSLIDEGRSVKENIIRLIASSGARLENEVMLYLGSEIKKMANANEVFITLAKGYSKFSDILSQSHVSSSPTLVDILNKLMRMGLVEKTSPINDEENRKKAAYHISDNLSAFYFTYIFRHASQMEMMDETVFYDKYIEESFETAYVPRCFEQIVKQYLIRRNKAGKINPVFEKIGKYYYDDPIARTNGEFDVVTLDENGYVFYEVKFRKSPLTKNQVQEEIEQVNAAGLGCYKYVFVTRSKTKLKESEKVKFISLEEIYC